MNMDCFLKRYCNILLNDENDALFQSFKVLVGGTTSHRIAKLINFAVSQMGHDECYVETGVFTGGTLISAFWANGRTCIGIDSYSLINRLDHFEDGTHLVLFKTIDEAVEKAKYYLAHREEREAIAAAGYREFLDKHTYEHRAREILKTCLGYEIEKKELAVA